MSTTRYNTLRSTYNVRVPKPETYDNIHKGSRGFILGGGPSIRKLKEDGFDFKCLEKEIVVGVNKAYKLLTPTYLVFGDAYFWKHFQYEVKNVDCVKFAPENILHGFRHEKIVPLRRSMATKDKVPSTLGGPISFVNNSGVGALRIAYALGCNPIYLIGIDIGADSNGETHFHDDYKKDKSRKTPAARYKQFYDEFASTIEMMKRERIEIFSCSEISPLNKVIRYVPIGTLDVRQV
jgi:hypothetical protein